MAVVKCLRFCFTFFWGKLKNCNSKRSDPKPLVGLTKMEPKDWSGVPRKKLQLRLARFGRCCHTARALVLLLARKGISLRLYSRKSPHSCIHCLKRAPFLSRDQFIYRPFNFPSIDVRAPCAQLALSPSPFLSCFHFLNGCARATAPSLLLLGRYRWIYRVSRLKCYITAAKKALTDR